MVALFEHLFAFVLLLNYFQFSTSCYLLNETEYLLLDYFLYAFLFVNVFKSKEGKKGRGVRSEKVKQELAD